MTVSYSSEVATTTKVGIFWKLLVRWKGSIYKLIWREVLVFIGLYYLLKILYMFAYSYHGQEIFEEIVLYCRSYSTSIPLSFVLGFYVNLVMDRWWQQYKSIPWPDTLGVLVSTLIHGHNERSRMMRRTIMRYVNCSYVMCLSIISPRVKSRFPSLDHLVKEGFMERNEKDILENLGQKVPHSLYWMPLVWASSIVIRARKEGLIYDDFSVKSIMDTITGFRGKLASLLGFNSISIPLVYTQVVTLAVYAFFLGSLFSSQYIKEHNDARDLLIPWFTLLQYLFYVGWLKVAETLVNPWGTDDDDFELNILIDRNFQVGYLIVDDMHEKHPELMQDRYWDKEMPASTANNDADNKSSNNFFVKAAHSSPMLRRMSHAFRRSEKSESPTKLLADNTLKPENDINEEDPSSNLLIPSDTEGLQPSTGYKPEIRRVSELKTRDDKTSIPFADDENNPA